MSGRRMSSEFPCSRTVFANEKRNASSVVSTFHVKIGVAGEPHFAAKWYTAAGEREGNRVGRRFVVLGIIGTDDATNIPVPAQMFRLGPKQIIFLVTNDAEIDAGQGEDVGHLLRDVRRLQIFRVNRAIAFVENFFRRLPSITKLLRNTVAYGVPDPLAGFR